MTKTFAKIFLVLAAIFVCSSSVFGQHISLGGIFSPSYYGLAIDFTSNDGHNIERFVIADDHYGFFNSKTKDIGFRITYLHEYVFRTYKYEDIKAFMHAGIGLFGGHLHDSDTTKEKAWTFGLASSIGLCLDFSRNISIDLSFLLTPGFNYWTSSYDGSSHLSMYINGLTHCLLPRIGLYYNF